MYALGLDSGSSMTKGVLFDGETVIKKKMVATSARPKESLEYLYRELRPQGECFTVTTGYGRDLLEESDKKLTEITCHAKGAAFLCPQAGSLIDIGGQDCKVILLDRDKNVMDFLMNDKCAAGTGRFIEMMLRTLEMEEHTLDSFVEHAKPASMNSMCTVFAESEIVSLLAQGTPSSDIALRAVHSICRRTANFARRLHPRGTVYFSGGLAGYRVFRETMEAYLELPVKTHPLGQYTGALGAAVTGWQKAYGRKAVTE